MLYRISIFINAALGLLFILLAFIGALGKGSENPDAVIFLVIILFSYGIFLLFDLVCYRILKQNEEKLPLTGWIKIYRKLIFILSLLALLCVLFITVAATYAFSEDIHSFPERQQPFYVAFLLLLVLSFVTWIINASGYFKSVKANKQILSEYIDDIGSSL